MANLLYVASTNLKHFCFEYNMFLPLKITKISVLNFKKFYYKIISFLHFYFLSNKDGLFQLNVNFFNIVD